MPVIPALGRWKQEGQEFKASLNYRLNSRPVWVCETLCTKQSKSHVRSGSPVTVCGVSLETFPGKMSSSDLVNKILREGTSDNSSLLETVRRCDG